MSLLAHLEITNPVTVSAQSSHQPATHHSSQSSTSSTPLPSPRPLPHELEQLSNGAIALEFLEDIQRVEINETRVRGGETFFVIDVFLYHFKTRLPANLAYLRREAHSTTSSTSTFTVDENAKPDYRIERRFSNFCDLRHQVYDAASLNPGVQCASCTDFICYVRFKLRQPRPVMQLLTAGRLDIRRRILAAFVNDFLRMALCREKQNHKCASHRLVLQYLEAFLQESHHGSETSSSRLSW